MSELDVIGTLAGTDKSSTHSSGWDYLVHYDFLFAPWRDENISILEIGLLGGSSIETWLTYFSRAQIVGVDINQDCKKFRKERVAIEIGSQEDPSFLISVAARHTFTIIIDDGSHLAHHMITSFETLFPTLAPGGLYVFEDLSFHFEDGAYHYGAKKQQGLSSKSIYEYLEPFIRARLANNRQPQGAWGFAKYAFNEIDSITVFGSALVIRKRSPRPIDQDVKLFEQKIPGLEDQSLAKRRYASYLVKHAAYPERALALLQSCKVADPNDVGLLDQLYQTASRLRKFEEALEFANQIAQLRPETKWSWQRVADVNRILLRPKAEIEALCRLIQIEPAALEALRRLSLLYEQVGEIEKALSAEKSVSSASPGDKKVEERIRKLAALVSRRSD